MSAIDPPGTRDMPVRGLVVSRLVDQGVLGLGALALARHFGPEAFAPVGGLFVFASLAVQLGDHGLSFALLRTRSDTLVARSRLTRVRVVNAVVAAMTFLGAVVTQVAVPWVFFAALLWCAAAEAYIRRSAWLKSGEPSRVARSEAFAAVAFAAGTVAVIVLDAGAVWVGAVFVLRHVVEAVLVGFPADRFATDGDPLVSLAEWLGQAMTYLASNVDYLVVAVLLTESQLSVYVVAFRFASAVPALLAIPVMQQAFVAMSAAREHRATYQRLVRRAAAVGGGGVAVVVAAALAATEALGEAWSEIGPVAVILSVAVPWRMVLGIVVATALSMGLRRHVIVIEGARAGLITLAVALGAADGLAGAAVGVTAATIASITAAHLIVVRHAGRLEPASATTPG